MRIVILLISLGIAGTFTDTISAQPWVSESRQFPGESGPLPAPGEYSWGNSPRTLVIEQDAIDSFQWVNVLGGRARIVIRLRNGGAPRPGRFIQPPVYQGQPFHFQAQFGTPPAHLPIGVPSAEGFNPGTFTCPPGYQCVPIR